MKKTDLLLALGQLAGERKLPILTVVVAIEEALVAAYRKEHTDDDIQVKINPDSGDVKVTKFRTVVADDEDVPGSLSISITEASKINPKIRIGDYLELGELEFTHGRIMAQNTKQTIYKRLREAEHDAAFERFEEKQGTVSIGVVYRTERDTVLVDVDHNIAVMPVSEQSPAEKYRPGQQIQVLISDVSRTNRGPEITVSRSSPDLLARLMEKEIPEINSGVVELKAIAREAGSRSKVAVISHSKDVDAIGACVGLRGIRIHNIVNEIMGEKIDVIEWSDDPATFIKNALSPATVESVNIFPEKRLAHVYVNQTNLSLAIGRDGQNVRLVGRLIDWKVNIENVTETTPADADEKEQTKAELEVKEEVKSEAATKVEKKADEVGKIERLEQELEELSPVEQETQEEVAKSDSDKEKEEVEVWDYNFETESIGEGLTFAEDLRDSQNQEKPAVKTKDDGKRKQKG